MSSLADAIRRRLRSLFWRGTAIPGAIPVVVERGVTVAGLAPGLQGQVLTIGADGQPLYAGAGVGVIVPIPQSTFITFHGWFVDGTNQPYLRAAGHEAPALISSGPFTRNVVTRSGLVISVKYFAPAPAAGDVLEFLKNGIAIKDTRRRGSRAPSAAPTRASRRRRGRASPR